MEIEFRMQNPQDVVLLAGPFETPPTLKVVESNSIWLPTGGLAIFRIIGESHWITICDKNLVPIWHEILACIELGTQYPQAQMLTNTGFGSEPFIAQRRNYTTKIVVKPFTTWQPQGQLIKYLFPKPEWSQETPFTGISWVVNNNQLSWETVHTYPLSPTETVVLQSNSTFET